MKESFGLFIEIENILLDLLNRAQLFVFVEVTGKVGLAPNSVT